MINDKPQKADSAVLEPQKSTPHKKRGTRWLFFWENILLPFNLIMGVAYLFIDFYILNLIFLAFLFLTIKGLKRRTAWGWRFNIVLLFLMTLSYPLWQSATDWEAFLFYFGIAAVTLLLPSLVYFVKRKDLFG